MKVVLISHTQLSAEFRASLGTLPEGATDGKLLALTAIRTCYSANKPSEIIAKEGAKYLNDTAADGEGGTEADRLIRHITRSGHTSTMEGLTFNFAVEGVSRALLSQLTRHRVGFSYSVQSQRYVRLGSNDRSGGFDYITPEKVADQPVPDWQYAGELDDNFTPTEWINYTAKEVFEEHMRATQKAYDRLRKAGVPPEDARAVLPNAAATNLVLTVNLRALLDFYSKRKHGRGSQAEICDLADALRAAVESVEPWVTKFFEEV